MDFNHEIEKYWREKFANEIEDCIMNRHDDDQTRWFNEGLKFAAMYIRYKFDDPIDIDDV
jgi:hypothetical protein